MAGRNGIPGIQQMRRIHGDIATCGFNITGTVNDFAVCRTAAVLLYPQTVAGQDITMLVVQTVCKQLQVIPRINQRTVQQGTGHIHCQTACRAGKTTDGDITPAVQTHIATGLK
ncbi:hypothetical protein BvCmsB22A_00963 [Escherichia coli]|nr:hypothetical protein BvCmsB22A_00963 [Escherichia coli]